eukprot:gene14978-biopygen11183
MAFERGRCNAKEHHLTVDHALTRGAQQGGRSSSSSPPWASGRDAQPAWPRVRRLLPARPNRQVTDHSTDRPPLTRTTTNGCTMLCLTALRPGMLTGYNCLDSGQIPPGRNGHARVRSASGPSPFLQILSCAPRCPVKN